MPELTTLFSRPVTGSIWPVTGSIPPFSPSPTSLTPKASSKCGANVANTTFALDLHGGGKSGANVAFTYSFGPDLLTFALCKYGANPFFHPVLLPYTQTIFLFLQMHL